MDHDSELHESSRECDSCKNSLYIRVDDSHQRIDFVCRTPDCKSGKSTTSNERASAKMQFCPNCRHMMRTVEGPGETLLVKCTRKGCTYTGRSLSSLVQALNHRKVTEDATINWRDMTLDNTLQRAYGTPCANPDCDSSELLLFQIHSPNGVESYAICTLCKFHWNMH